MGGLSAPHQQRSCRGISALPGGSCGLQCEAKQRLHSVITVPRSPQLKLLIKFCSINFFFKTNADYIVSLSFAALTAV